MCVDKEIFIVVISGMPLFYRAANNNLIDLFLGIQCPLSTYILLVVRMYFTCTYCI